MAPKPIQPIVVEPTKKHTATLIFLHDVGGTGKGWVKNISQIVFKEQVKIIFVTAPRIPDKYVANTKAPWHSWYEIRKLENDGLEEDILTLESATKTITEIIKSEIKGTYETVGVPHFRVAVGGYGQGASLALYVGLHCGVEIGGVLCMSGYLPCRKYINWNTVNHPRSMFISHGDQDEDIPFEFGYMSSNELMAHGQNVTFKPYPGKDHALTADALNDAKAYLENVLPLDLMHL